MNNAHKKIVSLMCTEQPEKRNKNHTHNKKQDKTYEFTKSHTNSQKSHEFTKILRVRTTSTYSQ